MKAWLDRLFNRHRFVRRFTLFWCIGLITWSVHYAFVNRPDIPGNTVTALGLITGLLATVIGFYQWHRGKDDRARDQEQKS